MTTQSCNGCDTVDYAGQLDEAGRCAECVSAKPESTTSGYTNCQACDEPTINALCEWCRLGALENNHDPDQIESHDFNGHLLAVWRASGEAIAEREQNEAYKRETGCDRGSWGAC